MPAVALEPPAVSAASLDVVLVMDSSGSMKQNDPDNLRHQAAKLFVSLLSPRDRVALVGFSGEADVLSGFQVLSSAKQRESFFGSVGKISSSGLQTDILKGIDAGLALHEAAPPGGQERVLILMTDGKVDTGDPARDTATTKALREDVPGRFRETGTRIFAIAFTPQSDTALLEDVAFRTDGYMALAETSEQLHETFIQFFEKLKKPESTPVTDNAFLVDGSVSEATVIARKEAPDVEVELVGPDGKPVRHFGETTGYERFSTDAYDMITLRHPAPGTWNIRFSHGDGNKVVVITNLKLNCSLTQDFLGEGMVVPVEVYLTRGDELVDDPDILGNSVFAMTLFGPEEKDVQGLRLRDEGTTPDYAAGDGIYSAEIGPLAPGAYRLVVDIRGMTFSRAREVSFRVNARWYSPEFRYEVSEGQGWVKAKVVPSHEGLSLDRTEARGEIRTGDRTEDLQFQRASGGFRALLGTPLGAGDHTVSFRLRHQFEDGTAYWIHYPTATLNVSQTEALAGLQSGGGEEGFWAGWTGAVIELLLINLLTGAGAGFSFYGKAFPQKVGVGRLAARLAFRKGGTS